MQLHSLTYLCIFLPVSFLLILLLPVKFKNTAVLAESLLFFLFAQREYFGIVLGVVVMNYFYVVLLGILKNYSSRIRGIVLGAGILTDLLYLISFRYLGSTGWGILYLGLPLGISYMTFQGISMLADIYQGKAEADYDPIHVLQYMFFFPSLTAGPIRKYRFAAPQILCPERPDTEMAAEGAWRITKGLFKKVMIADILGSSVDQIWNTMTLTGIDGATAWFAALLYMMQIYYDFSGYSDIAIGSARLLGFRIEENFDHPYYAAGIRDFWRRWHISLSTWFRDYVYIPLGGSRKGSTYIHLLVVFILTGIWHGSDVTFLIWGLWHAFFVILDRILERNGILKQIPVFLLRVLTLPVSYFGWIIFRAPSLEALQTFIQAILGLLNNGELRFTFAYYADRKILFTLAAAFLFAMPVSGRVEKHMDSSLRGSVIKMILMAGMLVMVISQVISSSYSPFIYFQF